MTDLTAKFDALETALGGKLDTVILCLDDIKTALTASSGNIDAAPIVAAIEALRGTGPENTIRSLNQSIWNIAGPTPGRSLAEIYTLLTVNHAAIGLYLSSIGDDTEATATALGIPTGDATTTLLGVMYSLQYIIGHINQGLGGIPYESLTLTTVRGLISHLTTAVGQTNQLLNPIAYPPVDACETPYVSTGEVYYQADLEIFSGFPMAYPGTIATWPAPPSGFDITRYQDANLYYIKLNTVDWTDYRIYVASSAASFGYSATSGQRLPTNQWLNLSLNAGIFGNDMVFLVDGSEALKVYICPSGQLVGGAGDVHSDGSIGLNGKRYARFTPPITGITVSESGIDVTAQGSWSGWRAYVQTTAPLIYVNETADYPAMWIDLTGTGSYNFAVDPQYTIYVTLRSSGIQYTTVGSVLYNAGSGLQNYGSSWPAGFNTRNSDYDNVLYTPAISLADNADGWTFRLISGSNVHLGAYSGPPTVVRYSGPLTSALITISGTTNLLSVYSPAANGPFTFEVGRPG